VGNVPFRSAGGNGIFHYTFAGVELVFGLKPSTLANKRSKAHGPEYIKDGDKILYKQQAIRAYLETKTVRTRQY
jgi:hypothetical protein